MSTVKVVLSDNVWAKKSGLCIQDAGLLKGAKIYVMTAVGT